MIKFKLRKLANKPSGTISMADLRGKSSAEVYTLTIGYWRERFSAGDYVEYFDSYGYQNSDGNIDGDIKPSKFLNIDIEYLYTNQFFGGVVFLGLKNISSFEYPQTIRMWVLEENKYIDLFFDSNYDRYNGYSENFDLYNYLENKYNSGRNQVKLKLEVV